MYDSKTECRYAQWLDTQVEQGKIKSWTRQEHVPIIVCGIKICVYIVDFVVENNDGSLEYTEVKGLWTSTAKLKWKLVHALYPKRKFVLVMAKNVARLLR